MGTRAGCLNEGQDCLHLSTGPGGRFLMSLWTAGPWWGLRRDLEKTEARKGLALRMTLKLSGSVTQIKQLS